MLRLKTELARESIECHRLCKELQVSLTDSLTHSLTRSRSLSRARALSVSIYILSQLSQWKARGREGLCSLSNCRS